MRLTILSWWSHPPFQAMGLLPFLLGAFLAWRQAKDFHWVIFVLALCGILLIMVATTHADRYIGFGKGKRAMPPQGRYSFLTWALTEGIHSPRLRHLWISIAAMALAVAIGAVLQFRLHTGPMTLILGFIGILPGTLSWIRSNRLAGTGLGELIIGLCYGWLPEVSAFYIQTGDIPLWLHILALPIGLSILNVILFKEFRDYAIDLSVGRKNLLTGMGKTKGAILYGIISILSWLSLYASIGTGIPEKALYIYLPVMALSAFISVMMSRKRYDDPLFLALLSGLNMAVHLGTMAACILAFL